MLSALKSSMESGDFVGAALAHRELSELLKRKQQEDTVDENSTEDNEDGLRYDLTELDEEPGESGGRARSSAKIDPETRASAAKQIIAAIEAEVAAEQVGAKPQEPSTTDASTAANDSSAINTDDDEKEAYTPTDPQEEKIVSESKGVDAEPGELAPATESSEPERAHHTGVDAMATVDCQPSAEGLTGAPPGESKPAQEQLASAPTSADEQGRNYYELFSVDPVSNFEAIHTQFLRLVKKLLAERKNRDTSVWQFRDRLRLVCVAHDVLRDPITRTDYDFRLLGLRGDPLKAPLEMPEDAPSTSQASRSRLRIGELLQCSEILDQQELEIAVDMHKAMGEMPFGQFLVKQEFLTQPELDSALLGQRLIADGKLTVAQFQVAMYSLRFDKTPLGETLVTRGWASQEDVDARRQEDPWAGKFTGETTPPPTEIRVVPGEGDSQRKTPIAASNALPSWAGQLDWGEEDNPEDAQATSDQKTIDDPWQQPKIFGSLIDTSDEELTPVSSTDSLYNTEDTVEIDEPPYLAVLAEVYNTVDKSESAASDSQAEDTSDKAHEDGELKEAAPAEPAPQALQTVELAPDELPGSSELDTQSLDKEPHSQDSAPAEPSLKDKLTNPLPFDSQPSELSSTSSLEQALALELDRLERQTLRGVRIEAENKESKTAQKDDEKPKAGEDQHEAQTLGGSGKPDSRAKDSLPPGKPGTKGRGKAQKAKDKSGDSGYFDNDM